MKKNLVIFFPSKKTVSHAYDHLRPEIKLREMQMLSCFPQEKVNIYMVRYEDSYHGQNTYSPDFQLIWDSWPTYTWAPIHADLVLWFNMPENVTHRYPCDMRDITIDKSILETIFPEYTIPSILCNSYQEIKDAYQTIPSDKKVFKPISESGGRGIIISDTLPKQEEFLPERFPYLLQTFHDTSWGFYDIHEGTHDFRVVILNGEIIWKILRTPKEWSFICNTWSGWNLLDIWDFKIPTNIMSIIHTIDEYCSRYKHRYYSIDLWVWKNWDIKVYELNSAAALSNQYIAHKLWNYIVKNILKIT